MSTDAVSAIENALAVNLPPRYCELLQAYPLDRSNANDQIEFQEDPKAIVAFNQFLREEFSDDWQNQYFAFGNSASGDPYFLDLADGGIRVYSWDHETHEVTELAPDLDQWLAQRESD